MCVFVCGLCVRDVCVFITFADVPGSMAEFWTEDLKKTVRRFINKLYISCNLKSIQQSAGRRVVLVGAVS